MKQRNILVVVSALTLWALGGAHAGEVTQRAGGGNTEALAKTQSTLRQVSGERDALAAEVDKLKLEKKKEQEASEAKIAALNKRIDGMRTGMDNTEQLAQKFQQGNNALRERITDQQDKMQKLVDKYKELVAALGFVEDERAQLRKTVAGKDVEIGACEGKNQKLYALNLELLDLYEHKGVWDALLQKEPVTQLKRVEVENIVEGYKERIAAERERSSN